MRKASLIVSHSKETNLRPSQGTMLSIKPRLWSRRRRSSINKVINETKDEDLFLERGTCIGFLSRRKARTPPGTVTEGTASTVNKDPAGDNDDAVMAKCCCTCTRLNEVEAAKIEGLLRILETEQVVEVNKKTNRQFTLEFMKCYNQHDLKAARDMVTDDYLTVFGDQEMNWDDLAMETQKLFDAFPDYRFTFQKVEELGDGVVILHHFIPCGTHTGKAYGFGPCEEIEPTGKYVKNDPEEVHFVWNDEGKLCRNKVFADGDMIGPACINFQIGGFPMV